MSSEREAFLQQCETLPSAIASAARMLASDPTNAEALHLIQQVRILLANRVTQADKLEREESRASDAEAAYNALAKAFAALSLRCSARLKELSQATEATKNATVQFEQREETTIAIRREIEVQERTIAAAQARLLVLQRQLQELQQQTPESVTAQPRKRLQEAAIALNRENVSDLSPIFKAATDAIRRL